MLWILNGWLLFYRGIPTNIDCTDIWLFYITEHIFAFKPPYSLTILPLLLVSHFFPLTDMCACACVCISSIKALCTACALISRSQTWGKMSAKIQYQSFQHWANGLLSERAGKQTWTRTPDKNTHSHINYLSPSFSVNQWGISASLEHVCVCLWSILHTALSSLFYTSKHEIHYNDCALCTWISSYWSKDRISALMHTYITCGVKTTKVIRLSSCVNTLVLHLPSALDWHKKRNERSSYVTLSYDPC